MEKASRNDPCPCGSGKKFKKCCENQSKIRTFQVLPSEAKVGGICSSLFGKIAVSIKKNEETEKS